MLSHSTVPSSEGTKELAGVMVRDMLQINIRFFKKTRGGDFLKKQRGGEKGEGGGRRRGERREREGERR
jgi:hypothetical protein